MSSPHERSGRSSLPKRGRLDVLVMAVVSIAIVGFLVWQAKTTDSSIRAEEVPAADDGADPVRAVIAEPPFAAAVQRDAVILGTLEELRSVPKGKVVHVAGLVVEIVDRPGVPYRVTVADRTGTADMVSFSASEDFKARIRAHDCIRLDARVDTYRGDVQLEPVAFSLVRAGSPAELGFAEGLHPRLIVQHAELSEGMVVAFEGKVLSAAPTRNGIGLHGEIELAGGDRIRYLWSDAPEGVVRAGRIRAMAEVGAYENRLQLRPFGRTARFDSANLQGDPEATSDPTVPIPRTIAGMMATGEGELVRIRGIVVDVVDSSRLPFMVTLADSSGSVKLVMQGIPDGLRARMKEALVGGEAVEVEARITVYRNEKQLQPVDTGGFEYLPATAVDPPGLLERADRMELGKVFRIEGTIVGTKRNRAGGLNGLVRLPSGETVAFIWWSPPDWARDGARIEGYARIGEFRGLQLEMTGSLRSDAS
jgi:hypothetical protein